MTVEKNQPAGQKNNKTLQNNALDAGVNFATVPCFNLDLV